MCKPGLLEDLSPVPALQARMNLKRHPILWMMLMNNHVIRSPIFREVT
jgi:hypothetical protein